MRSMLFFLMLGFAAFCEAAPEGAQLYQRSCADCHGRQADKKAFNRAPPLNSLSRNDIIAGLTVRRDAKGPGSGNRVKAKLTDEQITALADFIVTLK